MRIMMALTVLLVLSGCMHRGPQGEPGSIDELGQIVPCRGDRDSPENIACGKAIYNATVIEGLQTGQSMDNVRQVMKHNPESVKVQEPVAGRPVEVWYYVRDFDARTMTARTMTALTFVDGVVTEIAIVPWVERIE